MYPRNQAIARIGYQELSFIQWTMLIEPIHLPIPSITVLGYQGDHCTCIWLFGTPRFLAAKCQIQRVSPVLNVEVREFQPKIENYASDANNRSWWRTTRLPLLGHSSLLHQYSTNSSYHITTNIHLAHPNQPNNISHNHYERLLSPCKLR